MKKVKPKLRSKKLIFKVPLTIIIVTLVILGILIPFYATLYNFGMYEKQFEKNGVFDTLGRDNTQIATTNLFLFFKCRDTNDIRCSAVLDIPYTHNQKIFSFSEKEKDHLQDVKNLILAATWLIVFLVITAVFYLGFLFSIYRRKKKLSYFWSVLSKIGLKSGMYLLALLAMLGLSLLIFDFAFSVFHAVLFPQGNFTFSADSLLITLFPQAFFVAFTRSMATIVFVEVIALIVLGAIGLRLTGKIKIKNTLKFS